MDNNQTQLLIFDFDGTIADTWTVAKAILLIFAAETGRTDVNEVSIDRLRSMKPNEILQFFNVRWWQIPLYITRARYMFSDYEDQINPFPGIKTALNVLSKDYKLAIVSSNSTREIEKFLEKNDITVFDYIYGGGGVFGKHRKIRKCIRHFKIEPSKVIYIGDEVRDIEAAQKAGCRSLAVTWGFQSKQILIDHQPYLTVFSPAQLIAALEVN